MSARHHLAALRAILLGLAVGLAGGCGSTPTTPSPPPTPPPVTPPVVTAPTINRVTAAATRTEVDRDVEIVADVQDAETSPDALTYLWSATAGVISGSGRTVTWKLLGGAATPVDVTVSVTVIEPYQALEGGQLVMREHRVTQAAAPFRVHDSRAEITKMVRTFLIDLFGDINKSPDACLVDFSDSCSGKAAERDDIVGIRRDYQAILDVQVGTPRFGFNQAMTSASVSAPCLFRSVKKNGTPEGWTGDCDLTAVYERNRWWLCSSEFNNEVPIATASTQSLRPSAAAPEPGAFPSYFR
jgi:hypothetical protein